MERKGKKREKEKEKKLDDARTYFFLHGYDSRGLIFLA